VNGSFKRSVEINAPVELAYTLWADCDNFKKFMRGVQEVRRKGPNRWRWRAEQWGEVIEWEAAFVEDVSILEFPGAWFQMVTFR